MCEQFCWYDNCYVDNVTNQRLNVFGNKNKKKASEKYSEKINQHFNTKITDECVEEYLILTL